MQSRRLTLPHFVLVFLLLAFLIITSAAIIYTTRQNIVSVKNLAIQSLNATAFSLSSSAEGLIRERRDTPELELKELFADRIVAYALIADKDGFIHFHTNRWLVGEQLKDPQVEQLIMSAKSAGRMITLQTGQPAYEYSSVFVANDGMPRVLRLVLYTINADRIVAEANRAWGAVGVILFLLWGLAVLGWNVLRRYMRVRDDFQRRESVAMIGQMTQVLAHEIRNALAGVRGYTQWVEEKMEENDPRKTGIVMALQGTERIELLVNDLLLFSRDEHYNLVSVNAAEIVNMALSSTPPWRGTAAVHCDATVWVKADKEKLLRVLVNGIQNAVQAMEAEGDIQIFIRNEGKWGVIEICDFGPGLGESQMPRVFTPFYTTKTNGTGLGLAYSKKVVEGMGGRISLANRHNGKGAALTINLVKVER